MERERLVSLLKEYQLSGKEPDQKAQLEKLLLQSINRRVTLGNGKCAECAVRKILEKMHADTLYPALCLNAILELCRDDVMEFTEWQDTDLIRRINTNTYFSSLTPEQMVVETQDGVV